MDLFLNYRNALPCVWIDLWTRGIWCHERTASEFNENNGVACKAAMKSPKKITIYSSNTQFPISTTKSHQRGARDPKTVLPRVRHTNEQTI